MTTAEQIEQLMSQIGPLMDHIEAIEQEGEDRWAIGFDGDRILYIDLDESARKLTFSIDVGEPREEARERIYETLLVYNHLWEQTNGLQMSLDAPGGNVVMAYDHFQLDLDVSALASLIDDLLERAQGWRQVISEQAGAQVASDAGQEFDPMGPAIRV